MTETLKPFITQISDGKILTRTEASICFEKIMSGKSSAAEIKDFLLVLRTRGENIQEILGAVDVLRIKALKIKAPQNAIDVCGTGGDGLGTYNISTAVSFVVAAGGVPVAKHGNRSVSSKSGSADVLQSLGVNIDATPEKMEKVLADIDLSFFFAPKYHNAMRHVGAVRKEMGVRTIFNLLGPLLNPGNVTRQLIGVYDKKWLRPIAETLQELGTKKALIVCGEGGLDEITVTGKTNAVLLENDKIRALEITPQDALGYPENTFFQPKDLIGGEASFNAEALKVILQGTAPDDLKAYQDMVILNAAAAFSIAVETTADFEEQLRENAQKAREIIESGAAFSKLNQLIEATNV
ncbi:MAG: anthranilate phosphoribosyltransferase [Alphaproteobacteria bacterium]